MSKFEYKPANAVLEAYGKKYPIPTKTAVLVDGVSAIQKKLDNSKSALEAIRATKEGIALFIGEEETNRIFPMPDDEIDGDELSAFWFALNHESNMATQAAIAKYVPNAHIQKPPIHLNKK